MAGKICDVCNAEGETHVLSSGIGAVSFAYCERCARSNAEPYGALLSFYAVFGGIDSIVEGKVPMVDNTLEIVGKTWSEFIADAKIAEKEFNESYNAMLEKMDEEYEEAFADDDKDVNDEVHEFGMAIWNERMKWEETK